MEKIIGYHTIAEGKVLQIQWVDIDFGNQKKATFEMISFKHKENEPTGWVIVCWYNTTTTEIVLIKQFQVALGAATYLLPRGWCIINKSKLESAQQEFLEETGYEASQRIELPTIYASPWYFTQKTTIFLALETYLSKQTTDSDEIEETIVITIPLAEAITMIMYGTIIDARTISALLMCKEYIQTHKL